MHSNRSPGLPEDPISGRYRLLERLGGGSFADTYLAADLQLERQVAIKLLRASPHDPEAAARFEREMQAAAAVHHPNVVAIYDAGEHEGRPFLVMEWVGGSDLKRLIHERAPLPVDEAVAIMRDVLLGLAAIHRVGIIHRDVKPQNILISESGTAKVADFGIARSSLDTGLTETGVVMGTAAYLAPERAVGDNGAGQAADIYAAGVILYEMLTARLPFEADNSAALLYQHVHETPPKPRELNPDIPPGIETAILSAMAKDPAARYPSADAMGEALGAAPAAVATPDQPTRAMKTVSGLPDTSELPAVATGRRFPIPVAMTALVLGALGLVALLGGFTSFGANLPGLGDDPTAAPTVESVAEPAPIASPTATATASPSPTATLPLPTATPTPEPPEEAAPESPPPTEEPPPPTEAPEPTEEPEPTEGGQDDPEEGEDGDEGDDGEDENPDEGPPDDPGSGDDDGGEGENPGEGPPEDPGNGNGNPGEGPPENPGNGNDDDDRGSQGNSNRDRQNEKEKGPKKN